MKIIKATDTKSALIAFVSICFLFSHPAQATLILSDQTSNGGIDDGRQDLDMTDDDDDGGMVLVEREPLYIPPPTGGGDDTPDYEEAEKYNALTLERSLRYTQKTGTWQRTTYNLSKPITLEHGGLLSLSVDAGAEQAQVKLNGLENWTKKVLPVLAEENGLDHIFIHEELSEGMLQALDLTSGNWKDCVEYDVSADITIELPLDSNDVTANFAKGKKLLTDWDIDDSHLSLTVITHLENGPESGNFFCVGWNLLNALIGTSRSTVSSDDFAGSLDATLAEVVNSVVSVNTIDAITLKFSNVTLLNSDALTWLVDAFLSVGDSVAEVFGGGLSCNDVDECASDLVTDQVQKDDTKDMIVSAVNDAIEYTATVEGAEDAGDFTIDYAVALPSFTTSDANTLKTKWDVAVSTDSAVDPCSNDLRRGFYMATNATVTDDDIDVKIPFPLIDKAVYEVGKTGEFCEPVAGTIPGLVPVSVAGDIVPDGAMRIATQAAILPPYELVAIQRDATLLSQHQTLQSVSPTAAPTSDGEENDDDATKLYVTVPAKMTDIAVAGVVLTGQEVYVDVEIEGKIGLSCEDGLYMEFTRAAAGDITGTLSAPTGSAYDEDDLRDAVNDAIDVMEEDLRGKIPLVPKVNSLPDTGELGIEIGTVNVDDFGMHVGLNIVSDDVCAAVAGDDDDTPPVGGGDDTPGDDPLPPLNIELIEREWDGGGSDSGSDFGGSDGGTFQMQSIGF